MSTPDGFAAGQTPAFSSNNMSVSATLTTSQNGVVVVLIMNLGFNQNALVGPGGYIGNGLQLGGGGTIPAVQDNSGQNLTWQLLGQADDPYHHGIVQAYWAVTSAPFSNVQITANFPNPVETGAIVAFGLDNINLKTPLDTSVKLPATAPFTQNSGSISFTTANAPDIGLLFYSANGTADTISSLTPGWSRIGSFGTVNGLNYNCYLDVYYQPFTGEENTLVANVTHGGGTADGWELMGSAFQSQVAPVTLSRTTLIGF